MHHPFKSTILSKTDGSHLFPEGLEFKKNDRVYVATDRHRSGGWSLRGKRGTIVAVFPGRKYPYLVCFDGHAIGGSDFLFMANDLISESEVDDFNIYF